LTPARRTAPSSRRSPTRRSTRSAHFADRHPDLVDDVLAQSEAIEEAGLAVWADDEGVTVEVAFQTLVTGLAVRYFKAVAGAG
jgi:hypothetical protein